MAPGTVQTASVGDNTPGVTTLTTGPAKYDPSILKLTIPGINFNLSCPTGLHVTWTSQQPTAQAQQAVSAQGKLPVPGCCSKVTVLRTLKLTFISIVVMPYISWPVEGWECVRPGL